VGQDLETSSALSSARSMDPESAQVLDKAGRYVQHYFPFRKRALLPSRRQSDLNLLLPYRKMIRFMLRAQTLAYGMTSNIRSLQLGPAISGWQVTHEVTSTRGVDVNVDVDTSLGIEAIMTSCTKRVLRWRMSPCSSDPAFVARQKPWELIWTCRTQLKPIANSR
jgi:hypothetical protein